MQHQVCSGQFPQLNLQPSFQIQRAAFRILKMIKTPVIWKAYIVSPQQRQKMMHLTMLWKSLK